MDEKRYNPQDRKAGGTEDETSLRPARDRDADGSAEDAAAAAGPDGDERAGGPPADTEAEPGRPEGREGRFARLSLEGGSRYKLTGMYKDWFLDYASYVILERAVPHMEDGLKPVQRRILYSMRRLDDGRYNKVANVIGHTMQFHPHGDASIGDALVQLGQKDLLVDCQGNWGNILTGDGAAAPRYIEARLSKFALEVAFNPKTTEWMLTYDGRNQEPVTLPVKFPLLLAQGVEGIAVGLASKILPHNFGELVEASIAALRGEPFELLPDFPTGGLADCSRYNDGLRGGAVKIRARISKVDKRTLAITEIPYGTTTESIKDSIIRANERGKIKIKRVDDNTAERVEIIVHVSGDESADKTIDALYAFTDCEVSVSPNSCVIADDKPHFIGVSQILRRSAERTRYLLGRELEIRLAELEEEWHMASLERIFIENRIYEAIEGCTSREAAYAAIGQRLEPFADRLRRKITQDDLVRLTELRFIRISRYDADKADRQIKAIEKESKQVRHDLDHLTDYAVAWYRSIGQRYGSGRVRRTEIRAFDQIEAAKVVVANAKLYVDRAGGFFGIGAAMRKEEYVCDCSDIDEVIVFARSGRYIITRVSDKAFFAPDIYYIGVFKRGDERTIYNVLYRSGDKGPYMVKRCPIKGITRDKEYDMTKGAPGSRIIYMSVNPNGEAEVLKVMFRPRLRLKKAVVDLDFSTVAIRSRQSQGNLFSRYPIHRIMFKEKGVSTLAGQDVWYDEDVQRLNTEGRGRMLGEFEGGDRVIVFTAGNQYYTTPFDVGHHFPENTVRVEKYDPNRVYSVVYWDATAGYYYLKRFTAEQSDKNQYFTDENPASRTAGITDDAAPRLEVVYGGAHARRPADTVDVASFIAVKSHRAKGKRLTAFEVHSVRFLDRPESGDPDDGPQPPDPDGELHPPHPEGEPTGSAATSGSRLESGKISEPDSTFAPGLTSAPEEALDAGAARAGAVYPAAEDGEPSGGRPGRRTTVLRDGQDILIIERLAEDDEAPGPDTPQLDLFG